MSWFAVDKNGNEQEFKYEEPIFIKEDDEIAFWIPKSYKEVVKNLPKGTIEKLTGKKLTYKDKPLEYKN